MVTILPKENDWSDFGRDIGSGLVQGYTKRSDENALQKAIADLGENPSAMDMWNAISKTKTYSNAPKQNLLKDYLGVAQFDELKRKAQEQEKIKSGESQKKLADEQAKKDLEIGDALALVNNSDLPEEKKAELQADINAGKTSFRAAKELTKPQKATGQSEFQKGLSKEHVKQYVEAEKSIVQSQRNLNDLDKIDQLNKELAGPLGYFKALNPFNEKAAELNALGFGVIEPIVKIFNPSGPIAQKKLEQLQKRYGINALDSSATIRGKSAALRRYANYAKNIAEQRIALFSKYDGNPPLGEIARLDAESQSILDQMEKEDPTQPTIYYSTKDGRPIKAKSLEQQEELINKGLITDVKPTK